MFIKIPSVYFLHIPAEKNSPALWINLAQVLAVSAHKDTDGELLIRVRYANQSATLLRGVSAKIIWNELKQIQTNLKEDFSYDSERKERTGL